eukprot:3358996-Rhodomonas_salina.2
MPSGDCQWPSHGTVACSNCDTCPRCWGGVGLKGRGQPRPSTGRRRRLLSLSSAIVGYEPETWAEQLGHSSLLRVLSLRLATRKSMRWAVTRSNRP